MYLRNTISQLPEFDLGCASVGCQPKVACSGLNRQRAMIAELNRPAKMDGLQPAVPKYGKTIGRSNPQTSVSRND
jgi:hypothetical protein